MATIILYATKYGATEQIAKRISTLLDDAPYHNLKDKNLPPLSDFDTIIIGASVYAGNARKEARHFLLQNQALLMEKNVSFFLSGISERDDDPDTFFKKNVPAELLQKARATGFLGGIYDPKKVSGFERFIMKQVVKHDAFVDCVRESAIKTFAAKTQE